MKTILAILVLSMFAFLADLPLAGLGLVLVAAVLLVGDLVQGLPASACNQDCSQGDNCTCTKGAAEK